MKRNQVLKHFAENGCMIKREGGKHSVIINLKTKKRTSFPRHGEIDDNLCNKICKQLDIPTLK